MANSEVEVADETVNGRLVYPRSLHKQIVKHQINLSKKLETRVTLEQAMIDLLKKGAKVARV